MERTDSTLRRMLKTPPKPHKAPKESEKSKRLNRKKEPR